MASDDKVVYTPLPGKDSKYGKGELEPLGIILPPLQTTVNPIPNNWLRKLVIAAIIVAIVLVITTTVVAALVLTSRANEEEQSSDNGGGKSDSKEEPKPLEFDFEMDLRRVYDEIMDRNRPEELKSIFEYYESELSDVESPRDFRGFTALLRSEGLRWGREAHNLTQEDVTYAVSLTKDLASWYRYLDELRGNLTTYEVQAGTGAGIVARSDSLDIRKTVEVEKLLRRWTQPMDVEVTDSRVTVKKKVLLLSEVSELLKSNRRYSKPRVELFASGIVYMDSDLYLPGTDVALIAPRWLFEENVNIFISGSDAVEHEQDTAPSGEHGLPGDRGGNGGDFIGVGDFDWDHLQVHSDGGKGGSGQNGANGRDWTEKEARTSDWRECAVLEKVSVNPIGKTFHYYKIYEGRFCGENGTDGGAGGAGGLGGRMLLMSTRQRDVRLRAGRNGAPGRGGKGGTAGRSAATGCYRYAYVNNRGNAEPVTTRVCGVRVPSAFPGRDNFTTGPPSSARGQSNFFSEAVQRYRSYARDQYLNGDADVWRFLEEVDSLPHVDNVTPARDFLHEMDLIDENGKIEFYDSLNRRIETAMKSTGSEGALTYLRALSYGRMLDLKRAATGCIIVDLDRHLKKILDDLERTDPLTYVDETLPALEKLLEDKVEFLQENFDHWEDKAEAASTLDLCSSRLSHLTLITSRYLRKLSAKLMDYLSDETLNTKQGVVAADIAGSCSRDRFARHEAMLLQELNALSRGVSLDNFKRGLAKANQLITILNDLTDSNGEYSDFPLAVEYFMSTVGILESIKEKEKFVKYTEDARRVQSEDPLVEEVKGSLTDYLVSLRYREALNVFRQWVFPHMYAYEPFLPKGKRLTREESRSGINLLRKWIREYKSTITSYDKNIREATFAWNNSVGEYYRWKNNEFRSDVEDLFRGRRVTLTANVENVHILTKNAIKFRTARIEFRSRKAESDELLDALKQVQVEMRHSGYSYYYYSRRRYLQMGEGFDLHFSYELGRDGEPVNCNMVYKKLMEGPALFSPYTTWTIQLRSTNRRLLKFVGDVDIVLVGSGTYIEVEDMYL